MLQFLLRGRRKSLRVPPKNGPVNLQRVQVHRQSRPILRQYVVPALLALCAFETLKAITRPQDPETIKLKEQLNQLLNKTTDKKKDTSRLGAHGIRLMVPYFRKSEKKPFYLPDSKEWKAMAAFQKDQQRRDQVTSRIAQDVTRQINHPRFRAQLRRIGKLQAANTAVWLEIPMLKPPMYEVVVLRTTPLGLRYQWVPISADHPYRRWCRPTDLYYAFAVAFKSLIHDHKQAVLHWYSPSTTPKPPTDANGENLSILVSASKRAVMLFKAEVVIRRWRELSTSQLGICTLEGTVMLRGTHGHIKLKVVAYYDPSTDQFLPVPGGIANLSEHSFSADLAAWEPIIRKEDGSKAKDKGTPTTDTPSEKSPTKETTEAHEENKTKTPEKEAGK